MDLVNRQLFFYILLTIITTFCGGAAFARVDDLHIYDFTEEEYLMYPQFCRARLAREPKALVDYWQKKLGPKNFLHMHHYCFGLKSLNLAYANLGKKQRRLFLTKAVVDNFNYIIEHTESTFFMRADALLNLARGYQLREEYDIAQQKYRQAIKLNPKLTDAWVALSDMYFQLGQKSDALYVLEQASKVVGESKKIDLRISEMRAAGVKSSAAANIND